MNHETVDYVVRNLPESVRLSLEALYKLRRPVSPQAVSDLLSNAITSVDQAVTSDFMDLFPGGQRALAAASHSQMKRIINDVDGGARRYTAVARVLGGSTALLTLFQENTDSLWVANLGDSCAGKQSPSTLCLSIALTAGSVPNSALYGVSSDELK